MDVAKKRKGKSKYIKKEKKRPVVTNVIPLSDSKKCTRSYLKNAI